MSRRGLIGIAVLMAVVMFVVPVSATAATTTQHPYNKGCSLLAQDRLEEAAAEFDKALRLNPRDTDAANNRAVIYIKQGKHEEAVTLLRKVLATNPRYRGADLNIGSSYLIRGLSVDAEAPLQRATGAIGGGSAQEVREAAYYNLGLLAAGKGDYTTAASWFGKAGIDADTRIAIAVLRCARGDLAAGIRELESEASRATPPALVESNLQVAYYRFGLAALANQRLDEAQAAFDKSAALGANGYASLGNALVQAERGDLEAATRSLERIAKTDAPAEVKSAATENLSRIKKVEGGKSGWLKWLIIPGALLGLGALAFALVALFGAAKWQVRSRVLRAAVGIVTGVLVLQWFMAAWIDPFRGIWSIVLPTLAGLVVAVWVAAGVRR